MGGAHVCFADICMHCSIPSPFFFLQTIDLRGRDRDGERQEE